MSSLLAFMNVFRVLRTASWNGWRAAAITRITPDVRETYWIVGRGAGKSVIAALLACFYASRDYTRAPGERVYVGIFGPDRKQASLTFRYICGLLRSVPALDALIIRETRDSLELSNGVIIEVITASTAAPRGRAYALAIVEEAAFLPTDDSANPDVELIRALRPALARVPGSLLVVVSSPYARRGVLWTAYERYRHQLVPITDTGVLWAQSSGGDVMFLQAPTLALNPTFDQRAIARAYEEDPASAAAEYGAEFRSDVESFISREAIEAVVVPQRYELPRVPGGRHDGVRDRREREAVSGGDSGSVLTVRGRLGDQCGE